jgi:hypothetical protein
MELAVKALVECKETPFDICFLFFDRPRRREADRARRGRGLTFPSSSPGGIATQRV